LSSNINESARTFTVALCFKLKMHLWGTYKKENPTVCGQQGFLYDFKKKFDTNIPQSRMQCNTKVQQKNINASVFLKNCIFVSLNNMRIMDFSKPIILGIDQENGIIINLNGYCQYLSKTDAELISKYISNTIKFAEENDISKINEGLLEEELLNLVSGKAPVSGNNSGSFLYVMFDELTNYYKIGISKDPKYREHTMLSIRPTISLLFYGMSKTENSRKLESNLHKKYAEKRVRGEWFSLDESDLAYIQSVLDTINY